MNSRRSCGPWATLRNRELSAGSAIRLGAAKWPAPTALWDSGSRSDGVGDDPGLEPVNHLGADPVDFDLSVPRSLGIFGSDHRRLCRRGRRAAMTEARAYLAGAAPTTSTTTTGTCSAAGPRGRTHGG